MNALEQESLKDKEDVLSVVETIDIQKQIKMR